MAMTGQQTGDTTLIAMALATNLAALTVAIAEFRQAQQHAAQAAAARVTATRLYVICSAHLGPRQHQERRRSTLIAAGIARGDFPAPHGPAAGRRRPARGAVPPRRAGLGTPKS
jgi:hypothetical protein